MRKPHVYMCAGWFDPEMIKQYEEVYSTLKSIEAGGHIDLFAPKYDGIVLKKDDPDIKKKLNIVYWLDTEMIVKSDLLVVCTINKDIGSMYEAGFCGGLNRALGTQKKIICYNSIPEHGLNVMLMKPSGAFVKTPEDLCSAVLSFLRSYKEGKLENWYYNLFNGDPI